MTDVQNTGADDGGILEFLEPLTVTGGELFGDDGSVECGLMIRRDDGRTLFCSGSSKVTEMYRALNDRYAVDEGPAPRALTAGGIQVADDTSDPAHPPFFAVTAAIGFASILSVPLRIGVDGTASLNFYARRPGFFTTDRQRLARVFAHQAGRSVELLMRTVRYQDLAGNLRSAMRSRTSIDIAIGIIIEQNRCTQAEAFEILRRTSNARNIKLRDLADGIVEHTTGSSTWTYFDV